MRCCCKHLWWSNRFDVDQVNSIIVRGDNKSSPDCFYSICIDIIYQIIISNVLWLTIFPEWYLCNTWTRHHIYPTFLDILRTKTENKKRNKLWNHADQEFDEQMTLKNCSRCSFKLRVFFWVKKIIFSATVIFFFKYLPSWLGVDTSPLLMARNGFENWQHAHFKQSSLFIQIHQVEFQPFAMSAAHTEIEPSSEISNFSKTRFK